MQLTTDRCTLVSAVRNSASGDDEAAGLAKDNGGGHPGISGHRTAVVRAVGIPRTMNVRGTMMSQTYRSFLCAFTVPAPHAVFEAREVVASHPVEPLVANVSGGTVVSPWTDPLVDGAPYNGDSTPTQWSALGLTQTHELGAGQTLSRFVRRTDPKVAAIAVARLSEA